MNEMQSLTLNGKKYDSFPDQAARNGLEQKQPKGNYVKTINGATPDENGNVQIEIPNSGQEAVLYTEQELTEEQQEQARKNIGAMPEDAEISLSTKQINALDALFKAASYVKDVSAEYAVFCEAFGLVNPDDPSEDVVVQSVNIGSTSYSGDNTLSIATDWDARATLIPVGQYLKKGKTYKFSLGSLAGSYSYGVQILTATAAGLKFPYTGSSIRYSGVTERLVDTGYIKVDYIYTTDVDNCIFAVNFSKSGASMNASDYATIAENFTIEEIV